MVNNDAFERGGDGSLSAFQIAYRYRIHPSGLKSSRPVVPDFFLFHSFPENSAVASMIFVQKKYR